MNDDGAARRRCATPLSFARGSTARFGVGASRVDGANAYDRRHCHAATRTVRTIHWLCCGTDSFVGRLRWPDGRRRRQSRCARCRRDRYAGARWQRRCRRVFRRRRRARRRCDDRSGVRRLDVRGWRDVLYVPFGLRRLPHVGHRRHAGRVVVGRCRRESRERRNEHHEQRSRVHHRRRCHADCRHSFPSRDSSARDRHARVDPVHRRRGDDDTDGADPRRRSDRRRRDLQRDQREHLVTRAHDSLGLVGARGLADGRRCHRGAAHNGCHHHRARDRRTQRLVERPASSVRRGRHRMARRGLVRWLGLGRRALARRVRCHRQRRMRQRDVRRGRDLLVVRGRLRSVHSLRRQPLRRGRNLHFVRDRLRRLHEHLWRRHLRS